MVEVIHYVWITCKGVGTLLQISYLFMPNFDGVSVMVMVNMDLVHPSVEVYLSLDKNFLQLISFIMYYTIYGI